MHDKLLAEAEILGAVDRLKGCLMISRTSDLKTLAAVTQACGRPMGLVILTALRLYQRNVLQHGPYAALAKVYLVMNSADSKRWSDPGDNVKLMKTAEKHAAELYGDCLLALGEYCRSYKR